MNFRNVKLSFILNGFLGVNIVSLQAFSIGTDNTPGRPVPIQAPGAFQKPFNTFEATDPRAKIETETPKELATPQSLKNREVQPISVVLIPTKGSHAAGNISFFQNGNKIIIKGYLVGLTPGLHGMHIHENGDCSGISTNFDSAGPHFNPTDVHHGSLKKGHIGDLGNITANKNGIARFTIETDKFTLEEAYNSIMGRSIMVHKDPDDLKTNPAGKSGARILCGVIE